MAKLDELEVVANDNILWGGNPIWDNGRCRLVWTDSISKLVHQFNPKTGAKAVINREGAYTGVVLHKTPGGFLFAGSGGLVRWKSPFDVEPILKEHAGEKLCFSGIIADAKGRVYAGTTYWGAKGIEKQGKLYLIDVKRRVTIVDQVGGMLNGLGFSPDDRILYCTDSAVQRIWQFDVDTKTGMLTRKRVFANVPNTEGIPCGLTVDADGHIWSAQVYGSQVVRYRPDGSVERRLTIPAKQVTGVAFGGEDLKDLYITTASKPFETTLKQSGYENLGDLGGSLYRVRVNTQGRTVHLAAVM